MPDQPRPRRAGSGSLAAYEFNLFGRFAGRRAADGIDVTPRGRKARALLAYLLLERRPVDRERLAALLWSERGQAQAHASLRQCLLELRELSHSDDPVLSVDRHQIAAAGSVDLDLDRMKDLAERGDAEGLAAALADGEMLLENLDGLDPAFDQWLRALRTSRGDTLIATAHEAGRQAIACGRPEGALQLARQLQRIDPLDEAAARLAMEAAHGLGRTDVARRVYERLLNTLRDELGAEPTSDTHALYDRLFGVVGPPPPRSLAGARNGASPRSVPIGAGSLTQSAPAEASNAPRRPFLRGRAAMVAAFALLVVLGALLIRQLQITPVVPTVAVVAEHGTDPAMLARDLSIDLTRLAGARSNRLAVTRDEAAAEYLVRVSARNVSGRARADLSLVARASGEALWSASFDRPIGEAADLRPQAATKLGNVLLCALPGASRTERLQPPTLRLYLSACDRRGEPADEEQAAVLRRVTEQAPSFAQAWADLALVEAGLAYSGSGDTPEQASRKAALRRLARRHLLRARELNPNLGATYAAEAEILERDDWAGALTILDRGISLDPENADLHRARSHVLVKVGRLTDAVESARRAAVLDPLSLANRSLVVGTLAHAGSLARARRELAEAERIWPGASELATIRFSVELRYGDARVAQQMIDRGQASLGGPTGGFGGPETFMRARLDPTPVNIARLIRLAAFEGLRAPQAVPLRIQTLGQFGGVDEAYQLLEQPGTLENLRRATEVLFRPHMKDIRYDRRFPGIAARLGLLQFWRRTDHWPDFCSDPRLPYDCGAEARRLLGAGS